MTIYTYFDPEDPSTHPSPDQDGLPYLLVGTEGDMPIHERACAVGYWDADGHDFGIVLPDDWHLHSREYFRDDELGDYLDLYYTPITDPRQS